MLTDVVFITGDTCSVMYENSSISHCYCKYTFFLLQILTSSPVTAGIHVKKCTPIGMGGAGARTNSL